MAADSTPPTRAVRSRVRARAKRRNGSARKISCHQLRSQKRRWLGARTARKTNSLTKTAQQIQPRTLSVVTSQGSRARACPRTMSTNTRPSTPIGRSSFVASPSVSTEGSAGGRRIVPVWRMEQPLPTCCRGSHLGVRHPDGSRGTRPLGPPDVGAFS
jgi:hypothetical protein